MSAIQWAKTVQCDWPECTRQGEVTLEGMGPGNSLPPGWVNLAAAGLRAVGWTGERIAEFCPTHAQESLQSFTVAFDAAADRPFRGIKSVVSRETSGGGQ